MPTALLVSGFLVLLIVLLMLAVIRQAPGLLLRVLDPPNEPVVVDAGDDADVYRHLHLRPPSRAVRHGGAG